MAKLSLSYILAISCALFSSLTFAKGPPQGMPPAFVETATVKSENWQQEITEVGTLSANQGINIKPEISGRITGVFFHSGDDVKANAPLIQINPDVFKAQLASAEAKLKLSKANYERYLQLYKKHVFATADLDNALANYHSDQAHVAQYQALLNQALIRAPFAGRLGLRLVNLGDFVSVGQNLTSLQNLDPMRIDFNVPEMYFHQLKLGQTVNAQTRLFPNQSFTGTIYAFDATIDPNTRSLGVRATLPNKEGKLLPGGFVEVKLPVGNSQHILTVPETALSYDAEGEFVYKVVNNIAHKTRVKVGPHKSNEATILSGLNAGDVVVSSGQFKITGDNTPVMTKK